MNTLRGSQSIVFFALTFLFANTTLAVTKIRCNIDGEDYSAYMPSYYKHFSADFDVIKSKYKTLKNKHWNNFGIEKKYWRGRGFSTAYKVNTPINRTLRALELLRISKKPELGKKNHLNAAYGRTKKWIDHLRFECTDKDGHLGRHEINPKWWKERINGNELKGIDTGTGTVYLTQNMFTMSIIDIAGTIYHEARHKKKVHNGGVGGCPGIYSCDKNVQYRGANAYELYYSWSYGLHSTHSNYFTRQRALDLARYIRYYKFNVSPAFNIQIVADL